jgi:hypothetical protein
MRKRIVPLRSVEHAPDPAWLDLVPRVQVEVTSEEPGHPIEAALEGQRGSGWRAAEPGVQAIRLLFDTPTPLRHIWLRFHEPSAARTQEFLLRWSSDTGHSYRELVRQQWTFSPGNATAETEDYLVELEGVTTLELTIIPDISGSPAYASLTEWRLA